MIGKKKGEKVLRIFLSGRGYRLKHGYELVPTRTGKHNRKKIKGEK